MQRRVGSSRCAPLLQAGCRLAVETQHPARGFAGRSWPQPAPCAAGGPRPLTPPTRAPGGWGPCGICRLQPPTASNTCQALQPRSGTKTCPDAGAACSHTDRADGNSREILTNVREGGPLGKPGQGQFLYLTENSVHPENFASLKNTTMVQPSSLLTGSQSPQRARSEW